MKTISYIPVRMMFPVLTVTALLLCCVDGVQVLKAPTDKIVPESYLVHIKDSTPPSELRKLINRLHEIDVTVPNCTAKVNGIMKNVAYGFTAMLSSDVLQQVLHMNMVDYVEEDHFIYGGSARHTMSWGLDRIDNNSNKLDKRFNVRCDLTGRGVDVYVLDTGVNYNHKEFSGKVRFSGCDPIDNLFGQQMLGRDCNGHGTHVAGIITGASVGVATGVTLYSVRVLDCYKRGTLSTLMQGLECVLNKANNRSHRRAVVNLSLYGSKEERSIERAVWNLMNQGVTVVTISGNIENKVTDSCKYTPSNIPGLITVAATDKRNSSKDIVDVISPLTNGGACVDLFAPGTNINSTSTFCNNCYDIQSGSSMAAPFVTGSVALLLEQCPSLKPWEVKHLLLSKATARNVIDFSRFSRHMQNLTPNLMLSLNNICEIKNNCK